MIAPQLKRQTWGPSVAHSNFCTLSGSPVFRCICPKRYYCKGCDEQHHKSACPRTALDDMVEAMTFNEKSLKMLINEILDSALARNNVFYNIDTHIKCRIDELVERHGNLGMTRKKLNNLAKRELARRYKRGYRGLCRG